MALQSSARRSPSISQLSRFELDRLAVTDPMMLGHPNDFGEHPLTAQSGWCTPKNGIHSNQPSPVAVDVVPPKVTSSCTHPALVSHCCEALLREVQGTPPHAKVTKERGRSPPPIVVGSDCAVMEDMCCTTDRGVSWQCRSKRCLFEASCSHTSSKRVARLTP